MIKFYLRLKKDVYWMQISALVLEIVKFEKCVKYPNEMTDDITRFSVICVIFETVMILQGWSKRFLGVCHGCVTA